MSESRVKTVCCDCVQWCGRCLHGRQNRIASDDACEYFISGASHDYAQRSNVKNLSRVQSPSEAYICVYWYMKKVYSSLFSVGSHTFILIHNNTHILKRIVRKANFGRIRAGCFPIYTNTNIHARFC